MRRWWLVSIALLAASVAVLGASVATGDGEVGFFLIFPFIVAWGPLAMVGAALLLLSLLWIFIGIWRASEVATTGSGGPAASGEQAGREKRFGGVILIGPIPIAFGSDKGMAKSMLLLGVVLFVVLLIAFLILVHPFY